MKHSVINYKKPFFSIIIPTYNRLNFLQIAIDSVLSQTFIDYELIIIDDASNDMTKNYLISLVKKHTNIRYTINPTNLGVAKSRNIGIKQAKGKYICFLDSDDRFRANKLEITKNYIRQYPEIKVFHTDELWYRNGKYLPPKAHQTKPDGNIFHNSVKICAVSISTATIENTVFTDIGLFDKQLPVCEDYDLWLRISAKYDFKLIRQALTIKQGGLPNELSKKMPAMDKYRIYSLEKILALKTLTKDNYNIAKTELINKCRIYLNGARKRKHISDIKKYSDLIRQYD